MDFLVDRTYQREIKPVPTLSCGGVFRYRSGERLHGMQEVTGSIPVFSTRRKSTARKRVVLFFLYRRRKRRELPTKGKATAFVDHRMSQP